MRVGRLLTYRAPPFEDYDLICFRSPGAAPGFRLIERLIQYRHDGRAIGKPGRHVHLARPHDSYACAIVAQHSYTLDQFHRDEKIPAHKADHLKADWTRQLVEGAADRVHVIWGIDGIVGYCATMSANIELIAVAPEARGEGYGRSLVQQAIIDGAKTVGTQEDNPVRAMYESLGFQKINELNTWHWTR